MLNLVKNAKAPADHQVDILKNSSIPALVNQLLKVIQKVEPQAPECLSSLELGADLINCVSELSKLSFTKAAGIESVYLKNFIPMVPFLLK